MKIEKTLSALAASVLAASVLAQGDSEAGDVQAGDEARQLARPTWRTGSCGLPSGTLSFSPAPSSLLYFAWIRRLLKLMHAVWAF